MDGNVSLPRGTHPLAVNQRRRRPVYLDFLDAIEKAPAVRTLESLARIELGAQGGALLERVTPGE